MEKKYTNEEIRAIVAGAFKPLGCTVEPWDDYGEKLRVKVREADGKEKVLKITFRHVRDDANLTTVLERFREELQEEGYHLDPWTPSGKGCI